MVLSKRLSRGTRQQSSVLETLDSSESSPTVAVSNDNGNGNSSSATKRTRSSGPGSQTKPSGSTHSSKRQKDIETQLLLKQAVDDLINLAEYELQVDPYRGIFDEDATNSFTRCVDTFDKKKVRGPQIIELENESAAESEIPKSNNSGIENHHYGIISCPCVQKWMTDEIEKQEAAAERSKKAKRRRTGYGGQKPRAKAKAKPQKEGGADETSMDGDDEVIMVDESADIITKKEKEKQSGIVRRNPSSAFTCACDYNPFCIASLGGVVDDYLNDLVAGRLTQMDKSSANGGKSESPEKSELVEGPPSSLPDACPTGEDNNTKLQESADSAMRPGEMDGEKSEESLALTTTDSNNAAGKDLGLRKSVDVDLGRILYHLRTIIFPGEEEEVFETVSAIQQWHKELVYDGNAREAREGKLAFCRPVGMRNLGATCYLNSQVQCLAANLAFMHGVFHWTQNNTPTSQMSLVISRMQSLLARMVYGPQNIVCTDQFSSAMSLENNEMQDPNEFARLLFDRMHESFQLTSAMPQESNGLRDLLPNLFRGVFEYGTKCMKCLRVSRRKENFMDLNLPIVTDASSAKELTIEYLLEQYLKPEVMDGENKYHCSHCRESCEAERAVVFASTPPVLNIQLARYVFDLKTFRKQKLMNKILLPRSLQIDKKDDGRVKYILSAVQNHRGSSAYR